MVSSLPRDEPEKNQKLLTAEFAEKILEKAYEKNLMIYPLRVPS